MNWILNPNRAQRHAQEKVSKEVTAEPRDLPDPPDPPTHPPGADAEAIQIKGPQREEKEKTKGADAEAIQIKGSAEGGEGENKGIGRRGYTD